MNKKNIYDFILNYNLENKQTNDKNDTFIERIQLQIIRNLELSIQNIHIVYEDKSTKPDHPFAFGITLNYFTLHVFFHIEFCFFFFVIILNVK